MEVQSYKEAREAILGGADVIMLDNMNGDVLIQCARRLKDELHVSSKTAQNAKTFLLESSGGIDVDNVGGGGHVDNGEHASCTYGRAVAGLTWRSLLLRR